MTNIPWLLNEALSIATGVPEPLVGETPKNIFPELEKLPVVAIL